MPPKKTLDAGAGRNTAGKRQRILTNKQQQLGKISSDLRVATNL
jgi:hypothetical protein